MINSYSFFHKQPRIVSCTIKIMPWIPSRPRANLTCWQVGALNLREHQETTYSYQVELPEQAPAAERRAEAI